MTHASVDGLGIGRKKKSERGAISHVFFSSEGLFPYSSRAPLNGEKLARELSPLLELPQERSPCSVPALPPRAPQSENSACSCACVGDLNPSAMASTRAKPARGLVNLGNTCYLNSVVQVRRFRLHFTLLCCTSFYATY